MNENKEKNTFLPSKVSDLVDALGLIPHPEGGYFLEMHRSGSVPMSSRGQTNLNPASPASLIQTVGRENQLPDKSSEREYNYFHRNEFII